MISTSATLGEPGPDAVVLHAGVPLSAAGVSIVETWDTLGMRGTASHDVVFDGVFLPAEKVIGQRSYGALTGPLLAAAIHFAPVVGAAYLGVARGACDEAVRLAARRGEPAPAAVRQIGEMLTAGAGLPRRARRPVPPADPRGDAHLARRARPAEGVINLRHAQYGRRGMITHSTR